VTFEGAIPAKHEIYFSLSDNTRFRAPTVTITDAGGVDIEELPRERIQVIPFDALSGFKGFVVSNAMRALNAPPKIISPLVQHLPLLWELYHSYGMTLLEINPIRMMPQGNRLVPVACDFKCAFDINDTNWKRLDLPPRVFASSYSRFEQEINRLRTYQGQSDVFVINPHGTVTPMTFGGGANALVTELLGESATISTDFGGNPPYEKMRQVAEICYGHWLPQSNVLFIVGGKANNTDIFETFRAMADALRAHFAKRGPSPLFVVALRGGPRVVQGMAYLRDTLDALDIPHRMFGFTSSMGEVVDYVKRLDDWMIREGRAQIAERMGVSPAPPKPPRAVELVSPTPDSRTDG
jgi:succinyl-CoA synthetase beta subunit